MDMKEFIEHERIRQVLDHSRPITAVQYDPDIIGAIIGQAELLCRFIPNIDATKMDGIYVTTGGVALKLSALRYHCKRFKLLQEQRLRELESDERALEAIKRGVIICEKEMVFEFEAFFFQMKSCLDMLVKLFVPIFDSKHASISTYGDKGKDVITHLQQLKKNKKLNLTLGRVDWLMELVQQAKDPWLKPLIALCDTVSHYRSFIGIGFSWDAGANAVRVPMAHASGSEYPLVEIMEKEAEQMIDYSREFVARTVLCGVPLNIYFHPMTKMEKRYFSAAWGRDVSRAVYNLSRSQMVYDYTERDVEEALARRKREIVKTE
jgi:hypothetical protein